MLVLTRREGERLFIGPDIVVTVARIDGDRVRIGVDAPRNIDVAREEIMFNRKSDRKGERK